MPVQNRDEPPEKVKVGLVGQGLVGPSHFKGYQTHANAEVTAVCDCQGVWMRAEPPNGKFDAMHGFGTQIIGERGMIEVLGEGGHNLIWENQQQHLVLHREGKETQCFRFEEGGDDMWASNISYYGQGHINQVHHLIDCILQDTPPRYGIEEGIHK